MHTPTSTSTSRLRTVRRAGVALALVAGVAAGVLAAQPASALVTETDTVLIKTVGYDLGGETFANGKPDTGAMLDWDHAWFGPLPILRGYMHYEGVSGECTRVVMTSFDVDGVEIDEDISDEECANTNGHNRRTIQENGSDDLVGRGGATSVTIEFQHELPNGWVQLGQLKELVYGPIVDSDLFKINGVDLNFGSLDFVEADPHGYPADKAQVLWNTSTGQVAPSVMGYLSVENGANLCTRVRVRYLEADGTELDRQFSPELCPGSDALESDYVQFSSFAHNEVDDVQVTLQKIGGLGTWENDGSKMIQLN